MYIHKADKVKIQDLFNRLYPDPRNYGERMWHKVALK